MAKSDADRVSEPYVPYIDSPACFNWMVESSYSKYITTTPNVTPKPAGGHAPLSVQSNYYEHLRDYVADVCGSSGRLCDAGCGVGRVSFDMANVGWAVVGVDSSPVFVRFCEALVVEKGTCEVRLNLGGTKTQPGQLAYPLEGSCGFMLADILDLRLPASDFDVVVLSNVLDRLLDPIRGLAEAWRILKPGGVLVVTTPHDWQLQYTPDRAHWASDTRELLDEALWAPPSHDGDVTHAIRINERYVQHYICQLLHTTKRVLT